MQTPYVKAESVVSQARRQSAGMELHPELAHGLPFRAGEISALVAKYLAVKSDLDVLRNRAKAQAEEVRAVRRYGIRSGPRATRSSPCAPRSPAPLAGADNAELLVAEVQ